jgi:hypothetical protein
MELIQQEPERYPDPKQQRDFPLLKKITGKQIQGLASKKNSVDIKKNDAIHFSLENSQEVPRYSLSFSLRPFPIQVPSIAQ